MEKYYNYLQKALDYIQSAEYVTEDRGKRKLLWSIEDAIISELQEQHKDSPGV